MFFSIPVVFVVIALIGWVVLLKARNKRLKKKTDEQEKLINDIQL